MTYYRYPGYDFIETIEVIDEYGEWNGKYHKNRDGRIFREYQGRLSQVDFIPSERTSNNWIPDTSLKILLLISYHM